MTKMSDDYKNNDKGKGCLIGVVRRFSTILVIKFGVSLFLCFLLYFLTTGCCFAKDKIRYLVNNSDIMFYSVADFLCTSDYKDLSSSFSAVKLKDGRVLITGGIANNSIPTNKTLIYDPKAGKLGKFTYGPDMYYSRFNHASILLPDGRVFIYGGSPREAWYTTEFYDPAFNTFVPGPDLVNNIIQWQGPLNRSYFLDDKHEYMYVIADWCTNLLDLKNDKIYAFDPIRPHRLADESKYRGKHEGTDTIIGFENKTLEKDLVKKMKQFPPFYSDSKFPLSRCCEIIHYKDDLYYVIGGRIAPHYYENQIKNTISLYNVKTKEEKEINTKMKSYRLFTCCLKLKNNKVLIWGKDYYTRKLTYELFDMKTQKIKSINIDISNLSNPVVLNDDSILWMGINSKKGDAYILKFKEGVL